MKIRKVEEGRIALERGGNRRRRGISIAKAQYYIDRKEILSNSAVAVLGRFSSNYLIRFLLILLYCQEQLKEY